MKGRPFGWFRLAWQQIILAISPTPSYALSTLTAASATGVGDGTTTNTLTLTARDTTDVLMASRAVTWTAEPTAVSASQSTLTDDGTDIPATTGVLALTFTAKNAAGVALPNIQAARIVYSSTGTGNTFGTPTATNRDGISTCTFSSTVNEPKTISVTVDGVPVTQTAAVTVGGGYSTPNILNNLSFETDWDSFNDGGVGSPTANPETTLARSAAQAYAGTTSVEYGWVANAANDRGSNFFRSLGSEVDDIWCRFYFRLAAGWSIDSFQKFCLFRTIGHDSDPQFGGCGLNDASGLTFSTYLEASSVGIDLVAKASITTDVWHSVEVNYRRNGDALPNLAFWYDGTLVSKADGADPASANITWSGGRVTFGPTRGSAATMNMINLVGTRNSGNTGSGTIWIDRVAVSTLGRIGP